MDWHKKITLKKFIAMCFSFPQKIIIILKLSIISKKSIFSKKWKKAFEKTIQDMIKDGTMKSIIDSYIPEWYEIYTP